MHELFVVVAGGEYYHLATGKYDDIYSLHIELWVQAGVSSFIKEL